jgi:hypothetical protein
MHSGNHVFGEGGRNTTNVTPTLTLKGQGGKTQLGTTGPLMFGSQVNGRWTWNSASNGTGRTALRSARNMFLINSHLGVTWQNGKWNPVWSRNGWHRFGRDGDFDRDDFRFHHRFFGGNDFFFNGGFGFGCFDPFMSWPWWWNQPAYYYQPVAVEYPVYEPYPTGTPGYYGPDTGVYEGVPGVTQYGYNPPAANPANLDQVAAYVQNGDFARAENVLVKMLARNPSDTRLNYIYAYVLGLDQNYNSAAYILRRAITLNGDLLKDPATLMQGILQNDQFSAASARMDQFLIQNPDNVAAHLDRAFFYILSGTPGPASADLNTILGVNRNDQQANFLLQFTQPEGEPVR